MISVGYRWPLYRDDDTVPHHAGVLPEDPSRAHTHHINDVTVPFLHVLDLDSVGIGAPEAMRLVSVIYGWRVGRPWVWLLADVRQCVCGVTGVDFVYPVCYLH